MVNKYNHFDFIGSYVYLAGSDMPVESDLMSPYTEVTEQGCLTFYYYICGGDLANLTFGIMDDTHSEVLFAVTGQNECRWTKRTIPLNPGTFMVYIHANFSQYSSNTVVAVDDTDYTEGSKCPYYGKSVMNKIF